MLEICETGEQGGLIVGLYSSVHLRMEHLCWLQSNLINSINELPTTKIASAVSTGRLRRLRASQGWKVVTWLILPVVICLSQRLSHACASMN